jgi:RHS repeat-associated protein
MAGKETSVKVSELEPDRMPQRGVGVVGFESAVISDTTSASSFSYTYDGRAPFNTSETYCYDEGCRPCSTPFAGTFAVISPIFQTKCQNVVAGAYYYGQRFYSATLSRWINRDPIGESDDDGNINPLYVFILNRPATLCDFLGLAHVKNNTGAPVLAIGNVFITKKCRDYFHDVYGRDVHEGLDGVVFRVAKNVDTALLAKIIDVDGYWTTLAPGTSGFAMKIRRDKTLTMSNLATLRTFWPPWITFFNDRNVTSFNAGFLGETITQRVNTRFDVTYRGWMQSGVKACKCTPDDVANLDYAVTVGRDAIATFSAAL